ncbi:MAG: VTT domain-containing protein [Dehalococcoidia bacterium]|nr:VTT domain-containing protein [Dehalococcoidia bacterium]
MAEEVVKVRTGEDGGLPEPPPRRIVLDMPSWLPTEKVPRGLVIGVVAAVVVALAAGTAIPFALDLVSQDDLEGFGYAGIFLANFLGTATGFVPVPGLTAAGQGLIVAGSRSLNPFGVIVAGASGMTIAESTAYMAGAVVRGMAEERPVPVGGRLGRLMHRVARRVDWLMAHYGFATLLVLAGVPNPFFEFAGITAGAVRMNFWRFLLAVGIGKTIRVILLVIIGQALLDAFDI